MTSKAGDLRSDFLAAVKCIKDNDIETMSTLIKKNKKILKMSTKEEKTLLHFVAEGGFSEMLKLLAESGSSLNAFDKNLNTPMHLIVSRPEINSANDLMAKSLIDLKADLNAKGTHDVTPLMCAVNYGQVEMAKAMLNSIVDETQTDDRGATVLHWAAQGTGVDCLNMLLLRPYFQKTQALNACDKFLDTPLYYAIKFKRFDKAKILLSNPKVSTNMPCFKRSDVKMPLVQLIKDVRGDAAEKEFLNVIETLPSPPNHHLSLASSSIASSSSSYSSSDPPSNPSSPLPHPGACVSVATSTSPSLLVPLPLSTSSSSSSSSSPHADVAAGVEEEGEGGGRIEGTNGTDTAGTDTGGVSSDAAASAKLLFQAVDYDPFNNDNEIDFPLHGPFTKEESMSLRTEFIEVSNEDEVYAVKKEEDDVIWYGD